MAKSRDFDADTTSELDTQTALEVEPWADDSEEITAQRANLVVLAGESAGKSVPVDGDMVIGQSPECSVRFTATSVSRRHAAIRRAGSDFVLKDLGSRNGTLVNGTAVEEHTLQFGDRISIGGGIILLFNYHDDLEEELLHQQRIEALGQLAGGIAHDFNNLIGAVLANASFLAEYPLEAPLKASIADIKTAASRATELTTQLLAFARRGKYEDRPLSISDLAAEVISVLKRTFHSSIRIELAAEPALTVIGDRSQLHQVLMNLCINARDSMAGGGRILVAVEPARADLGPSPYKNLEECVLLSVTDTGQGMTDDVQRHVFEPFFTTKALGEGSGLGLATVYGIVKNHGGKVLVESQPGLGSTFRVYLPRCQTAPNAIANTETGPEFELPSHEKGTILVVDDEELHVRSCSRLLVQCGYSVLVARSGMEAVEIYKRARSEIQVVLLDLRMPGMSGQETCLALRTIDESVRILANSGYEGNEQARAVLAAGALVFLRKPYHRESLESAIRRVMMISEAARQ